MVIVPIVVSSKVCSLQTERAREEEMAKVNLSQVRTVCRSSYTGFVHRAANRDLFRVLMFLHYLTLKFQNLSFSLF